MVLVNPKSNKTLRSLVDGQMQMVLHVAIIHDHNFDLLVTDISYTDVDAW